MEDLHSIIVLLGTLIPVLAGGFGIKLHRASHQIKEVAHAANMISVKARDASALLHTISTALEDDKITASEAKIISKQLKALIGNLGDENNGPAKV